MKLPTLISDNSSGQSLVEILIALAVTAVVILALVVISLMGLKNAQFAQNQAKVTKYAQEAIDQIKTIRDRNGTVNFRYSTNTTSTFSDLWARNLNNDCSGSCYFNLSSDPSPVLSGNYQVTTAVDTLPDGFSRVIKIEDNSPLAYQTEKRIVVMVKWTDGAGNHESNVQTILTKY